MSKVYRGYSNVTNGQAHWRRADPPNLESTASQIEASVSSSTPNPLICLHMMPKSSRSYQSLMTIIGDSRVVIAPDMPGHGASDPPLQSHSISNYTEWLWELLDAMKITRPVDFLGYHTGAMVAVAAATKQPQRVERIVSISAPAFSAADLEFYADYFAPTPLDKEGTRFSAMWQRVLKHAGPGMTLEMCAASMSDNLLAGEKYEEGHRAAFAYADQYMQDLAALRHPVLVMNIADELQEATARIDPFLRNGERREYPQWGHGFLEIHAPAAADEMLSFLDE